MNKTIEQKALKFIDANHLINKGDKILVALSGGADSVFLLAFLLKFKYRFKIDLAAFHLNHMLRGRVANDDEKFCSDFCSENKVEFYKVSKAVKDYAKKFKVSIEEAGREIRYIELAKAAKKNGFNKIATAHNANDNIETILLNLIKGAGLKGLSGIPIRRDNIIRPILSLKADEIREYLKVNKIPFRVDESNLVSDYERNFLRNEIIPKLKQKLNPRLEEKICNTSNIISEINSFIENQVDRIAEKAANSDDKVLRINLKVISKLDKNLLGIFLKSTVENNFEIELSSGNIFALVELMKSQSGKTIHLKEKIIASKERGELVISKESLTKNINPVYIIKVGQSLRIDSKVISIIKISKKMFKFTPNKSIEFISADGLRNEFEIRRWMYGDKFQPIGMKGTKKISDFLMDEKISSMKKNEHLVLTNSDKIIWVIGLRIDEQFKVTPESKNILKLIVSDK